MTDARAQTTHTQRDVQFAFANSPLRFLRRMMLRWLKGVFRAFPPGEYKFLGDGMVGNEIQISAAAPIQAIEEDKRPAIILQRTGSSFMPPGMGAGPVVQSAQLSTGVQRKTTLLSGAYAFHCCARVGDEAEHLAWTVSFWLQECMPLITKLGFHTIGPPQITPISAAPDFLIATSSGEWQLCSAVVPFSFQYSWDSKPASEFITSIDVELLDELDALIQDIQITKE